jgi:hypothetical protein
LHKGAIQTDVFPSVFVGTPNCVRQEVCREAYAERGSAYPKAQLGVAKKPDWAKSVESQLCIYGVFALLPSQHQN